MTEIRFTAAARRHVRSLLRAVAPQQSRLARQFRAGLRRGGVTAAQARELEAITPAALSGLTWPAQALEHLRYHGRRLALLNVPLEDSAATLDGFAALLDAALGDAHGPAQEQLQLASMLALESAYYRVREAEAQAFFGIERAEIEARDVDEFLKRAVRVLTRAFRARSGRLILGDAAGMRARYVDGRSKHLPQCRSSWIYPLRSGSVILLGFEKAHPWLPRELALLQAIAARCDEAIERDRSRARIRALDAEARSAEEQERRRIGRELHDEAGQSLLLLRLRLEMIEREADAGLRGRLGEVRRIAEGTIAEVRRIVAALSPAVLERLGLEAAVRQLAARFRAAEQGVCVHIGKLPELQMDAQQVLYRAAQELFQNASKHSGASRINLSLGTADKKIRLCVSDNGAGFCAEAARNRPAGFGLAGLRERATMLGGSVQIRSSPARGSRVTVVLPIEAPG